MNKLKTVITEYLSELEIKASDIFALFLCAFISASTYTATFYQFDDLTSTAHLSPFKFFLVFAAALFAVTAAFVFLRTRKVINWCLVIVSVVFAIVLTMHLPTQIYFNLGLAFILFFILRYALRDDGLGLESHQISEKASLAVCTAVFCVFVIFVSFFTVIKYMTFGHSAFDFGIFCQMFEQMAETGLPNTTVERGRLLSHFAVHFSPVYYLLLPGYMLFRNPVYLLIMQAVIVGLGMFPLRKICTELGMSPFVAALSSLIYAFFPSMANGCFYDFHENKFLSLFILWMIYFALRRNSAGTFIFAILILSVKEDSAIYVIAVALWMLLTNRRRITAVLLMAFAALYFVFACNMIALSGGEIMMSRLDNFFVAEDGGFADVIKTCFFNIGYLIKEVFSGADTNNAMIGYEGQKVEFLLWTMIPLALMPFASRHTTHLVLFIPMLVINLMPDWVYQYNIDYQYTYGTCALAIAAGILALSEKNKTERVRLACIMCVLCIVFSFSAAYPKADRYFTRYAETKEVYNATAEALETIPEDASVTAYGTLIPHLYYIDELQTAPKYYGEYERTEYVALDTRYSYDSHTADVYEMMGDDYELILEKGYTLIYRLSE